MAGQRVSREGKQACRQPRQLEAGGWGCGNGLCGQEGAGGGLGAQERGSPSLNADNTRASPSIVIVYLLYVVPPNTCSMAGLRKNTWYTQH